MHGPLNESATLAGSGQAVNGTDRGFLQDDVDAFGHGIRVDDLLSTSYTHSVCMSNGFQAEPRPGASAQWATGNRSRPRGIQVAAPTAPPGSPEVAPFPAPLS